jgi:hypothetical protein
MANPNPTPPPEEHRWKPGQSGNPRGRPPEKPIRDALKKVLDEFEGDTGAIHALAKVAVKQALKGDHRFWREVRDMIDGPIRQEMEAMLEGAPVKVVVVERRGDHPLEGMGEAENGSNGHANGNGHG